MRFAVGLLDYLFGDKVMLEVPTSDGQIQRRSVTRRWLEQMEREGKIREAGEIVRVHHIGLHGYEIEHYVIGQDISPDTAQRFRDPQTQDMYAMSFMKEGKEEKFFLKRDKWEATKATIDEVDSKTDEAIAGIPRLIEEWTSQATSSRRKD